MRRPTTSEKRLLALTLLTIFLVVNLFVFRNLAAGLRGTSAEIVELEAELKANQAWLSEVEYWDRRAIWIDTHLPGLETSPGQAQGQLMAELQESAAAQELTFNKPPNLPEHISNDHYQAVAVVGNVSGDLDNVTAWLTQLQNPSSFYHIRSLDLELDKKSESTTPQLRCNITLARWFKPNRES